MLHICTMGIKRILPALHLWLQVPVELLLHLHCPPVSEAVSLGHGVSGPEALHPHPLDQAFCVPQCLEHCLMPAGATQ